MRKIVSVAPDVAAHLIGELSTALPGVAVRNARPDLSAPYRLVIVRSDLQQKVTPLSRYCRVGLTGIQVDSNGRVMTGESFDLANTAASVIESLSGDGIVLDAEIQSGPSLVVDEASRAEQQYVTMLLEVLA